MIFEGNRRLSSAIHSNRASKAIDNIRWQSAAIARSIAIGGIRLLSIAIAFSASAAIETAGEWAESASIRFESRDWAADVMAGTTNNSSIAIEGGRLQSNAIWAPPATHLVLNTVYVPSGISLTIATNCVVKFCPGTCIKVEDGGKLNIAGSDGGDVIFTAANDVTAGEAIAGFEAEQSIAFEGIRLQSGSATFTDNGWLETRGFDYGAFPGISVNATEAVRNGGMAYVPFTLSGSSRDKAFSVEWEAVAGTATYGDDYTLASGRISWNKSGDGTKTLAIPLNTANITGEERTFSVRIKAARCANVVRREATVKIVERDGLTLEWADEWAESAPPIRFESREWAEPVLAGATNNDSIAVEGGRLLSNTLWAPPETHLVLNNVYVPSGITLTIATNCVVKFCPGTCIKVEDGGKLNVVGADGGDVILTAANDDTVGETIAGFDAEQSIAFDGIRLQSSAATFTDNGWLETRGFSYGSYPSVSLNDSTAFRSAGEALVPVTISGSRNQSFTVDWEAIDETAKLGNDYTLASGRITWSASSDGTKTLRIPLVADHIVGSNTTFKLRLTVSRGANIARGECTVTIKELDFLDIDSAWAESTPPIRFESRDWADPVLAGATNNPSIVIDGGRLLSNTTWNATATHLVLNTVYVPSGITLTIPAGAVVKFCPGTTILVEDGGKLNVVGADGNDVILTAANDATVGEPIAGFEEWQSIAFDGIRLQSSSAAFADNGWLQTRGFSYGSYPTLTIYDATANRKSGMIYLPVTVGGTTRNQSFNVDWVAVDETAQFGRDYITSNSGRLTWSKSGDGTKYITIPLAIDEEADSNRTFNVKFVAARGCNVSRSDAAATIAEFENGGITDLNVVESDASEPSAEFSIVEGIKTQPMFLNDTETVQYSGKWQLYDANEAAVLRVTLETDNGATVLKETSPSETGSFDLDLKQYPVGYYTLKHEVVNDLGETLATMQKTFSIADDEDVVLHGGVLASNEVWAADKVHVVYETVVVPSIYTIFIEPGAIVKFMTGTGIDISQGGAFFANRIVFTHINDDTVGGDTLNDGFTVAPPMDAYFLSGAFTFGDDTELRGITQNNALTGTIATQKTLSRGSTYRVSGTLTIANGGSLTIPAGTVLKMEAGAKIEVSAGGSLISKGTRASPIVITSIKDDSYSGDTNGDGSNSRPAGGDWQGIWVSGKADFEYTTMMYAGKGNERGIVETRNSGVLTLNNCIVAHAEYDGIWNWGGAIAATNTVVMNTGYATAPYRGSLNEYVNCVFYGNNVGMCYWSHWTGKPTYSNCIFNECSLGWCELGGSSHGDPPSSIDVANCVFWNPEGYGLQSCGRVGSSGNIWGDPLFLDPVNGDFRVKEGSPCVDAADGTVAPELDFYGQPRITITDHGDELVGQLADIGVCEVMPRDVVSDIDLVPQSVRTTTNAVPGQLLFVKWEIANVGGREVDAAWRDTVSLVSESGREVVLGVKTTSSRIGVGGSVFCSAYFTVPAISEGTWYPKVNVNSYHDIFEGSLAANNALTGERAVSVGLEALDPSIAREGVINGGTPTVLKLAFGENDDNRMMKFGVPAGVKATWGFGFMPQGASKSGCSTAAYDGVMFRVPDGAADVYVILESDTTTTYNLSTESTQMTITSVTPATLPSSGTTTLTITGAGFGETNALSLISSVGRVALNAPQKDTSGNLIATVDCATLTAGQTYAVRVESGENAVELPGAVSVVKAEGKGILELEYDVPSSVRPGRVFTFTVTYRNTGNKDMCVPLLTVQDTGNDNQNPIQFSLDGERFTSGGFQFVGNDAEGGFGPLHPGDEVTLLLMAKIPPANNGSTAVSVRANTESDIMAKYTTEIDRYLTPAMKAEFAATADAELKARGDRMAQVFGANNGEMVQNFAALAERFYECNGFALQKVDELVAYGEAEKKNVVNQKSTRDSLALSSSIWDGYGNAFDLDEDTGVWVLQGFGGEKHRITADDDLSNKRVAIIAHGLDNSVHNDWVTSMAFALKESGMFDVVLGVNWEKEADWNWKPNTWLPIAESIYIDDVGVKVGLELARAKINPSKTTLIGHSFGSHLLGYVAAECFRGHVFERHIGLDTAETKQTPDGYEVKGGCALRTEFYRTSSGSGRNGAYAHENYIVCPKDGFDIVGFLDPHSYAHTWFIKNIGSKIAKDNKVGFWSERPPLIGGNGFLGVINGDDQKLECVYRYGQSGFNYPGNKSGWLEMRDAWKHAVDLDITNNGSVSLRDNAELQKGVTQHITVRVSDNCDIQTVDRMRYLYRLGVYFVGDGSSNENMVYFNEQFGDVFDFDLVISDMTVPFDGKGTLIFRITNGFTGGGNLLDQFKSYADRELYASDNVKEIPVTIIKTDLPVACINGESQDGFVIRHEIPYKSYEVYEEAVKSGKTFDFKFDGTKSIGGGDKKITGYRWRLTKDDTAALGEKSTLTRQYSATLAACYPICLTVDNNVGETSTVNGMLEVEPVWKDDGKPIEQPRSYDPNEMVGPLGVGDPETQRFVKPGEELTYTIYFENKTNATAAAQEVYVSQALNANLDWSTFEMSEVAFGDQIDLGLAGKKVGASDATMTGTNLIVRTSLMLDETTGQASWYLRIVDPTTDTGWPKDILAGFLPPNDPETHCGEGHITYRVKVRNDVSAGARIDSAATIVFDYNDPIETDPSWWNTVAQMQAVVIDGEDVADGGATNLDLVVGVPYGELPTPKVRAGYTFGGWFTGPNGTGRRVTAQSLVEAGDNGLYALWLTHAYTVHFNANGGEGAMSDQAFAFDKADVLDANVFARRGYSFLGWATNETGAVVYEDEAEVSNLTSEDGGVVDLFAVWQLVSMKVTFDPNGGSLGTASATAVVTNGFAYGTLPTAVREGYSFVAWTSGRRADSPVVTAASIVTNAADHALYAQWRANSYTVVYEANGGEGEMEPLGGTYDLVSGLASNAFSRISHRFLGWATSADGPVVYADGAEVSNLTAVAGGTVTLYAVWELLTVEMAFDAQGGSPAPTNRVYLAEIPYGELPEVSREGYTFGGWYTGPNGTGRRVTAQGVAEFGSDGTLYANWLTNAYTVRFNANGGEGVMSAQAFVFDKPDALDSNAFVRANHDFIGWSMSADGESVYADGEVVENLASAEGAVIDLFAVWVRRIHTVDFYADETMARLVESRMVGEGLPVGALPASPKPVEGYSFAGWRDMANLGTAVTTGTIVVGDMKVCAVYTANTYTLFFDAAGGSVSTASKSVVFDEEIGRLPHSTRDGYTFEGWYVGNVKLTPTMVYETAGDSTATAHWTKDPDPEPEPEPEPEVVYELYSFVDGAAPVAAASEYNGYLYDEKSGAMKGTIQVKVGKLGKKDGKASVKATVVLGAKKVTLKAKDKGKATIEKDGPTEVELVGGEACEIALGAEGLAGYYGAYLIDGSRNFFASKDKGEVEEANTILSKWLGSFMVIWDGGSLSVSIAAKGKVKVSGTLANGKTKVSASTVLLVGEEWCCVSVAAQKANLAFVLWLSHDGQTIVAEGLGDNVLVGKAGALANGAVFHVDADEFAAVFGQTMLPYLPDGVPVTQKGTKWTLPKAGKVVYKNGAVDESKLGENPCGLKLTYKAKEGTFKGSFKVYSENKGKPKATTVNVTGFLLNGVGYGTATIKGKNGSVAVTISSF